MKRNILIKKTVIFLIISTLLLSFVGCGQKAEENKQSAGEVEKKTQKVLKLGHFVPVGHPYDESMKFFANRVGELTNDSIKVEVFPAEQLGKLDDLFELTQNGTIEMGYTTTPANAGICPVTTVTMMPYWTSAAEGQAVTARMLKEVPEVSGEYSSKGTRIIFNFSTDMYNIGTTKKPVHFPNDVKGLRLASAGGLVGKIPGLYGINPSTISITETYDAMQKGIVDGAIHPINTMVSYKLAELVQYQTKGLRMGGASNFGIINEKVWQTLTEDEQKALMQAGEEAGKFEGELWDKKRNDNIKIMEENGVTVYEPTPEEMKLWEAELTALEEMWINDMTSKGLDVERMQDIWDQYIKICEEITK